MRLVVGEHDLTGTVTLAVATLDQVFSADQRSNVSSADEYAAQVIGYVDAHLEVDGTDGSAWAERYSNLARRTTEGIETITIELDVDPGGADPANFSITYDAVIEAVPGHEAVLVLENAGGSVSTPGVFASDRNTVNIGADTADVAFTDMIRFGFHHVLDGADHLLFLLTLLLPASFMVAERRWRRQPGVAPSARKVLHVVTAFTVGHSLTLAATSLGWITIPTRPVEVLIAASVAVSAVHAIRPLVRGGEPVIAATFGLVHGLAFAGILHSLGLQGRTSLIALLAFNIGVEFAQLAVVLLVLPSLYVLTSGRGGGRIRIVGATIALVAASAWTIDRIGLVTSPITPIETALVANPWRVVITLAALALLTTMIRPRSTDHRGPRHDSRSNVGEPRDAHGHDASHNSVTRRLVDTNDAITVTETVSTYAGRHSA